jgi:voltage-gated potassium channel
MRDQLYRVIFESDTKAGRQFDIALVVLILLSLLVVVLDSVSTFNARYGRYLNWAEWFFTAVFTVEYVARLYSAKKPLAYAFSFYGIVDLLSILPTYLALIYPELAPLIDVRLLRLLRVFRIFKLTLYVTEYRLLAHAIAASKGRILVFLYFVLMVVFIMGTIMYVIEGPTNGFTSIPVGVYWAISTMTTVGFGDIVPKTDLGRFIASIMMLMGWGVLAVPTGIVTSEIARTQRETMNINERDCPQCDGPVEVHDQFCRHCGVGLEGCFEKQPNKA